MKNAILALIIPFLGLAAMGQDYKGSSARSVEDRLNDEYCSGMFQSTHGTIIDVASDASAQSYFNILEWLQGRVAGLQVYKNRYGVSIPVLRGGVPAVFIDEVQVSPATINSLSVRDIGIVKIIRTPFYGGFNGGNGAIAIYTLGGEEDEDPDSD